VIDIFSARRNRRISAQSSTFSTYFLPGSDHSDPARVSAQVLKIQLPRPVQFSRAADNTGPSWWWEAGACLMLSSETVLAVLSPIA
jgi:hypothetical protein